MRIAVDAFGGDNAPEAVVAGVVNSLAFAPDFSVLLCGNAEALTEELKKYQYDKSRIELCDAKEIIGCDEQPTLAIKRKRDSSMVKAIEAVANKEADVVVSGGSTGALLTGATLIIKRIAGVKRPALAVIMPTVTGGCTMLIDCGANADCKPGYLVQFAVMATAYMRDVLGVKEPRIGLLNNGAEAEKGNELTKAAHKLLSDAPVNFTGNCEARDILTGEFDAVVCDGFTGNIVLKHTEGLASAIMSMLRDELTASLKSKVGAALSKGAFRRFKKKMDYKEYGGAPLLGINGGVIKAHGSSDARAFESAMKQAYRLGSSGITDSIRQAVESMPDTED